VADDAHGTGRPLSPEVAERLLRLAAYLKREAAGDESTTLERITEDLDDYAGLGYEAARKKVRRDLGELDASFGIVVDVSDTGEYRLRPPFLTAAERRALFAAAAAVHVDDRIELTPGELAAGVDTSDASVVLHVHEAVRDLRSAIADRCPVAFLHAGIRRVVEPWALGHWRRRWYVVGFDRVRDAPRRFRLDRIEPGEAGLIERAGEPGSCEIPAELDLAKTFDLHPDAWGDDPPVTGRVLVDPDYALPLASRLQGRIVESRTDGELVEAEVRHYDAFVDRVLEARDHAVVLAPPVLVERIRDHLQGIVAS